MSNDTTAINDIVSQKAEEIKSQSDTGDTSSQQQQQNDGSDAGGGAYTSQADKDAAALAELEAQQKEADKLAEVQKLKDEATAELLKKFDVDSIEELEEKIGKKATEKLSKEDEDKANELYEANLRKFAVEKGIMKLEDFDQLTTLKSKQDAELVYEGWLKDWKEENSDIKPDDDTTEADIEKMAKDDFEKEFKLNSEKESVKAKGIAKLAKLAAEIRNPKLESYQEAKEQYDADTDVRTNFPKYVGKIEKIVSGIVPEKVEWFRTKDGEEDIPIEIDLPAEDRKEIVDKITKRFQNPDTYQLFKDGKLEEIKERVEEYSEYLINKKTKEMGNAKVAEIFLKRGVAQGSKVGATNSFATNQAKAGAHESQQTTAEENKAAVLKQFGKK